MAWSEERLHRWLAARVLAAPADDAAVLAPARGRTATCVDQTVEGVHFRPGDRPARVGAKAVGRVLSDLAATAAEPRGVLLALSAGARVDEAWIRAVIRAVARRSRELGCDLLGGDLCCAEGPASLTVSALGSFPARRTPPRRDRARAGQTVVLTGPVGGAALGRHLFVEPRLAEGRWLFERGATAMIDVSDGLALDLSRVARASGVRVDLDEVPVHRDARRLARESGREASWHALHDGEDHELLATLGRAALARVLREASRRCPALRAIGRVRPGRGLFVRRATGDGYRAWNHEGGWLHGG